MKHASRALSIGDKVRQRIGIHKGDDNYILRVIRITPTNVMFKVASKKSKVNGRVYTMSVDMAKSMMEHMDGTPVS